MILENDGSIYFCGDYELNASNNNNMLIKTPTKIDLPEMIDISSGIGHIVALSNDGEVYAWGRNKYGQLGNGLELDEYTSPEKIESLTNIIKIESGINHSIALDHNGNIYAWGDNSYGQFGNGNNIGSNVPVLVDTINDINNIAVGYNHTIFVKNNDGIYACGNNEYGQLGNGITNNSNLPIKISNNSEPVSISGGLNHTLEIDNQNNIYVWGSNINQQLGVTENTGAFVPVSVYNLDNVISIASGKYHNLALRKDGTVWSWGYNSHKQLGDGSTINIDIPKKVMDDVKSIAAGHYHSLALKTDGTVYAWGFNGYGQLGNNGQVKDYSPVKVDNLTDVKAVAAGEYHSLALKNDGTVYSWGRNENGQLGNGSTESLWIPHEVEGLTDIKAIAAGQYTSFAIKENGTVYAWGVNCNSGQLGDGTTINRNKPVELTLNDIQYIAAGPYHTLMLDSNGKVSAFGDNSYYQYGNIRKESLENIKAIAAGQYHSLMLTKEGKVLACGNNKYGQLGNGTDKRNVIPIEIEGLEDVVDIAAGYGHSVALKKDGTLMTWGNDGSGQLGIGRRFVVKHPCLLDSEDTAKQLKYGENSDITMNHIYGMDLYKFKAPYNITYDFSVTQGCEIEIYKNNSILNDFGTNISKELKSGDEIFIKVIRKSDEDKYYKLRTLSNLNNSLYKKSAVTVNGNEYYINLYDGNSLYKDDIKLTNYPVTAICSNADTVFIACNYDIYKIEGTTLTNIVSGVHADFIAADSKNIYFSDWYNGCKIYYSKIGSNKCSKLSDNAGIFLETDDTYLYYYNVNNRCELTKIKKVQ